MKKGLNLSAVSLDPKPVEVPENLFKDFPKVEVKVEHPPKIKKKFASNKKEFIPETYVILFTLEGHTTWRVFNGFWFTWEAQLRQMLSMKSKITAARIFKLNRLTGSFNETPS